MSQLIALIIAIALGAIVTAIGYVFLGDAFTKNSERGVALQFVNQASQVEMALTAFRAENAKTGFLTNWAATTDSADTDGLVGAGYLKDGVVAPQGAYELVSDGSDVFMLATDDGSNVLSVAVCEQINRLAGGLPDGATDAGTNGIAEATFASTPTAANAETALNGSRYNCFETSSNATSGFVFAYEVE